MQSVGQSRGVRTPNKVRALLVIGFAFLFVQTADAQRASYRRDINNQVNSGGFIRLLNPGVRLNFGNPDDIVSGADSAESADEDSRLDLTAATGSPLRISVVAKNHERAATARIYDRYTFDVPYAFRFTKELVPGLPQLGNQTGGNPATSLRELSDPFFAPSETPILAQVSGRVDIRGYLAVIGVGQVRADVNVTILDVGEVGTTEPAFNHFAVKRHQLLDKEVVTSYDPQLGFGFNLEGGSDFEGGGTSVHAEFRVPLRRLDINMNDVDFGFEVMLRRGRRYQLQMNLLAEARTHSPGLGLGDNNNAEAASFPELQGRAIAAFWYHPPAGANPIPGLPARFQDDFRGINQVARFREIWRPIDRDFFNLRNLTFFEPTFFDSINDLLFTSFGIATDINDNLSANVDFQLANGLDGLGRFYFPDTDTAAVMVDPPAFPGVTTDQLFITLENDQVDFLDKFERREIEKHLASASRLLNLKTPYFSPVFGAGRYELVRDNMIQLAEGFRSQTTLTCGMTMIEKIQSADIAAAANDYDLAFRELHDAYVALRDCDN